MPGSISAAINYANTREDIDILIVGRGGVHRRAMGF